MTDKQQESSNERPRAPLATALVAQDYGTMSQSGINTSDVGREAGRPVSHTPRLIASEPPRAAARKRIPNARQISEQFPVNETQIRDPIQSEPVTELKIIMPLDKNAEAKIKLENVAANGNDDIESTYQTVEQHYAAKDVDSNQLAVKVAQNLQQPAHTNDRLEAIDASEPKRSYPKKVLFIVANEFCERFSYYGLRSVLVLYFRSVLGLSDPGSTVSFHLFVTLCYFTPILGAILGDSILGKYKTILYLSMVYFLGELLLVISSIWWNLDWISVALTWMALLMIGIGTGGIKPCVSAFGGDQFRPNETKWRDNFFSLFYGAINLGSLISMFLTPMLKADYQCVDRNDCYPLAFLVPCILMLVSIVVFLLAHKQYYVAPLPEKNLILAFCQCTWLAFKRKLNGYKLPEQWNQLLGHASDDQNSSTSTSNLSVASNATGGGTNSESMPVIVGGKQMALPLVAASGKQLTENSAQSKPSSVSVKRREHWLYLASDCYDFNSIEEFRSILAIFFLFLPTPMFWALFDQQGSLWTLQATRMDGRLPGTDYRLEPDQMMVANPVLLLASIPIFQLIIYPMFNKCNLLTTPIQKMTTGGFLAALTFVVSALIEFQIQAAQPTELMPANQSSLLLVNGISDCRLVEPTIFSHPNETRWSRLIEPLGSQRFVIETGRRGPMEGQPYRLTFLLGNSGVNKPNTTSFRSKSASTSLPMRASSNADCPFDPKQNNELLVNPVADQSVHLLYIEQGNGKLNYKLFNESLKLPEAGKARVRLLYESFGSYSQATKRQFSLSKDSASEAEKSKAESRLRFNMTIQDGQVLLSDHMEVPVSTKGSTFTLNMNESLIGNNDSAEYPTKILLKPGTINLIILHQKDAKSYELRQELLQDNDYQVSIFYQLAPYLMISASEVLFSITGLEFSYSMAPPDMKSLILGAWCLTTAFGNLLTVAIEAIHFFDNIGYNFLLYAALMFLDILIFAMIGYNFEPYEPVLKHPPISKQQVEQPERQLVQ